jgi:GNAT superfamily N-acetyltransferase
MSLQISPLRDAHLEDAATLVSTRYRALREHVVHLPSKYEEVGTLHSMLREFTRKAPGVAALRGGRLVGFLAGMVLPIFRGERSVLSPEWANGAELSESRRPYEEMYRELSPRWVANGCFTHVTVLMEADQDGLDAWQWLGFGLAAVDAVRGLEQVRAPNMDIRIRRGTVDDIEDASALGEALERHMASAPTYLAYDQRTRRQDYEDQLRDRANAIWLADDGAEAIASMGIGPANPDACTIIRDDKTASIVSAYTRVQARGRGIGSALLNQSLEWARSQGYERCAVDFEPMNIVAARFWTRHFEPICYALMRCVDERIAWAHQGRDRESFW